MFNRNIAELHSLVSIKDPVHFITTDEKIGIKNGYIYYEKTKPYRYGDAINVYSLINEMNRSGYQISIDKIGARSTEAKYRNSVCDRHCQISEQPTHTLKPNYVQSTCLKPFKVSERVAFMRTRLVMPALNRIDG